MKIDNLIIKHYLKNVLFINGTAYAGKSTMVKMLSEKYGLIHCGENYNCYPGGKVPPEQGGLIAPDKYPHLAYTQTMRDWQEFVSRAPEEYDNWIQGSTEELIEFEITYLMSISQSQKVIVDTNLPADILREIANYNQVAVMLAPPSMSIEHFFNRDDDKPFILEQIKKLDDPEWGIANYRAILEKLNSQKRFDEWLNSGFFTLVRKDTTKDTRLETMEALSKHFGLLSRGTFFDTGNIREVSIVLSININFMNYFMNLSSSSITNHVLRYMCSNDSSMALKILKLYPLLR